MGWIGLHQTAYRTKSGEPSRPGIQPPQLTDALQQRVLRSAVWLCLSAMLLSRISTNVVDMDIFHQMALARESIALGHIPTVDRFAYTPTLPYSVHHEWG